MFQPINIIASFDKNQNILYIIFSPDYKKYLVDVKREIIENSVITEQNYSTLIYDTDTNAVIKQFDSLDNEGIKLPKWFDSNNIIFEKFSSDSQDTSVSLQSICLFNVSTGETIELNPKIWICSTNG